jgi:hypothetical protein
MEILIFMMQKIILKIYVLKIVVNKSIFILFYILSNIILANSLSITHIDWTEDEKYVQYTGENKQIFIAKIPCKYSLVFLNYK